MKKILIVGKDSYIGEAINAWLCGFQRKYLVEIVSPLDGKWKEVDFSQFDTVINLAGIAHIKNITEAMKDLFYSVNRDLVIQLGKWAKQHQVRHFVNFSSMNVYGDFCGSVRDRENVAPSSFYGDSKLQGDEGLFELVAADFMVSCIRPPFVYGKGCKGNYNTISKIAKNTPVFPNYTNKKSMIYIDNLCEFVRLLVDNPETGVFTPQNRELVSTAELVREISIISGNRIWFTKLFNMCIYIVMKYIRSVRRAFADDCYILELSNYFDFAYCVVEFKESIRRTEHKENHSCER